MKTLQELSSLIESSDFDARYLMHSGFTPVLSSLSRDEIAQDLIELLKGNPASQEDLVKHIESIIPDYEAGYLHTHDVSLTAYLYALEQLGNLEALVQIIQLMHKAEGFFWSRKLAQKILSEKFHKLPQKP